MNVKLSNEMLEHLLKPLNKPTHLADVKNFKGLIRCSCGKKMLEPDEHKVLTTSFTKGVDRTCRECKKMLNDMCPILCCGCREIVAYLPPGIDEDGFVKLKNTIYHVRDCPSCNPTKYNNKNAYCILAEKAIFLKHTKGIPLSRWY